MKYDNNIDAIIEKATVEIKGANSVPWLDQFKTQYIGPNGILPRSLKSAESLPEKVREERVELINKAIKTIEKLYKKRVKELKQVKK